MLITQNDPLLIVTNDYITGEAVNVVIGSNAFLLLKTDKNIISYTGIVEISQHRIGAELYSLIRKVLYSKHTGLFTMDNTEYCV